MIPVRNVFHLAIPTHNLDDAENFYTTVLGANRARRYSDRVTFNFLEHQVVCHLYPSAVSLDKEEDLFADIYPRHFGMTFLERGQFDGMYERVKASGWSAYKEPYERFGDLPAKHLTFLTADPSRNVIEFKWYYDQASVY